MACDRTAWRTRLESSLPLTTLTGDLAVSRCKEDPLPQFEAGEFWGEMNHVSSHHGRVRHLGPNG